MSAVYLGKYDFCVHDFFCCKTNTVHTAYPLHLIFDFKLFGDTLLLCHPIHKLKKHSFRLGVDFGQVTGQLAR